MSGPTGAFARLRQLVRDLPAPPGLEPIQLQLGEARLGTPPPELAQLGAAEGWTRYPQLGGSAELRAAYSGWLDRRFGAGPALASGRVAIEPTPGSKQALAVAIALAVARVRGGGEPAVVMPTPFYPAYRVGAAAAGARAVHYRLTGEGDAAAVAAAVPAAGGPVAAVVVCNPGSPRGEILPPETLRQVGRIAAAAGAVLVVDECYTDSYTARRPPGYLSVADQAVPGPFLVLHSLSKRSAAPGLRSGFLAGDPASVAGYADYNRECGVSSPQPVCAAAAALWSDDGHVARLRAALGRNWDLADELLAGLPGYRRADAGFFLWLPVPDDEVWARRLWRDHGLLAMPGRYLSAPDQDGVDPGIGHLRIALVHDPDRMREALTRLRHAAQVEEVPA
jgi:N-succinyldiaminopimelate aminotransferase